MAFGRRATFDTVREVAFGGVGAAYAALGTATTDYTRIFSVFNSTDADIDISLDGVNDHLRIAAGTGQIYDFTANKVREDGLFLPRGTVFYQKRTAGAPTSGALWVQVTYATGGA